MSSPRDARLTGNAHVPDPDDRWPSQPPRDDESPILLTWERISSLLHSCPFDPEVLENVQDTLQRVENFLHQCSGTHSTRRGSAAGDPLAPHASVASDRIPTKEPQRSSDFQIAVSSQYDLPVLLPNTEFDNLHIESNLTSASTVTTIGEFFDYTVYAADRPALVDVTQQQEESQEEGDQGRDKHDRANIVCERANRRNVLQEEEVTAQETHDVENQEVNDIHNTAADEIAQALVNETCSNDGSQSHTEMNTVADALLVSVDRVPAEHAPHTRSKQISGHLTRRTRGTSHSLPRTAGRQKQPNQRPPPVPDQTQATSGKGKRKRVRREKSQHNPTSGSITWPHVAPLDGKTACLDDVLQHLTAQAGEFAPETDRMRYLADLYIYSGGPHAFQQIRDAFSALCCTEKMDCTTVGGRVRALDRIDNAHHFVRRAVHLGLYIDRLRETQIAHDHGEPHPDRTALGNMTSCAYPNVVSGSAEYKTKKARIQRGANNGQNWFVAHQRYSSALWLIPKNVSEKR